MRDPDNASIEEVNRVTRGLPMPEFYYRAELLGGYYNDGMFIHNWLSRLTIKQRSRVADAYSKVYAQGNDRTGANTRLRAAVELCEGANQGRVIAPPMMRRDQ